MKQKASDIINRALHLSDLNNTDFLSHWEQTQYINDAWRSVYQWLINKGDKQFCREVELKGSNGVVTYDLPSDLWQIQSIKLKGSNRLITRKADSESDSSSTYEIFNNQLRLFGCPGNLILTYWTVPVWITYPDKEINVTFDLSDPTILSSYKNSVLYTNSSSCLHVKNVVTGEDFKVLWDQAGADYDYQQWRLGEGQILHMYKAEASGQLLMTFYDFNGNRLLHIGTGDTINEGYGWVDKDGAIWASSKIKDKIWTSVGPNGINRTKRVDMKRLYGVANDGALIIGETDDGYVWMDGEPVDNNLKLYLAGDIIGLVSLDDLGYVTEMNTLQLLRIDSTNFFLRLGESIYLYIDGHFFKMDNFDDNNIIYTTYGPLIYTGYWTVKSIYEDTEFNFPNELYFSLLAADLAMRYLMKQNADLSGLQQLYQGMKDSFMNTLSQDGAYMRIRKVYRS